MTANLQSIDLSKNKLTELPLRLFQAKNISFFSVEQNNLEGSLRKDTFEGLQLITKLDMSYQSIKSIEDFAFFGLDNLTELLLNNNNIESLSNKSFQSLRNLVHLDLSNNRITIIDFNKEDLVNLRSLLFHNNYIAVIKSENLRHLHLLEFLDLSKNNISKIESQSFEILGNVNNLLINQNPLSGNLEENTFKGLTMVPKLDLSNTGLNVIMNGSFNSMTNLYYLNISHSKLNISHNALLVLNYGVFRGLINLVVFDTSFNFIKSLETERFYDVPNLQVLIADHNRITDVSIDDFQGTNINKISIGDNPLPCEVLMKLKKASTSIAITALRHVVDNEENIDGISCNNNFHEFDFKIISNEKQHTGNYNESVLNEIKDILLSLGSELVRSGERTVKNENLLSLNNLLQQSRVDYINKLSQLSNVTLELNEKQETITKLLERILKVMVAINSLNSSIIPVRSNVTSDNFIYYLNKIRQDFDNAMILDKEKILDEMENKISLMMKRIQSETHTTSSLPILSNQKLPLNYEPKSYV
ncbi:toll-like receptor 3 [Melitaea cinxia]|uniref:toll-like receptor 3 n=1 Tax=Melitaea cinxia TaxID=113334 RepID=UPI001E27080B|nr:toll-like receptor 3 [Melitaea cinxia]